MYVQKAPVPYIVGVGSLGSDVESLIVDLDNFKLVNCDPAMPLLPELKKL